jgi:hypothetical protein
MILAILEGIAIGCALCDLLLSWGEPERQIR